MKRILLASVAALGLAGTASAADLAVKAPVVYAPAFTWSGCYLGINGGWIGSDESYASRYSTFDPPNAAQLAASAESHNTYSPKESAGTAGGQFGCQAQLGSWVIGGEWDWNWTGLAEDNVHFNPNLNGTFAGPYHQITHKELDWFSTARVRLGLAFDRLLVYATGGLAYGQLDAYTHVDSPAFVLSPDFFGGYRERRFGWTAGGGIEWAFANNWTAKAEFLYLDFGSFDYISPFFLNNNEHWRTEVDAKEYVARVGINYLFHTGGAPVVAKY